MTRVVDLCRINKTMERRFAPAGLNVRTPMASFHTIIRIAEKPWRLDPVMAQGRQEGHGLPAAVWNLGGKPLAAWPQCRHIGPGPGLIDEDQTLRLDAILIFDPLGSPPCDVWTIAFASHHAFF